MKSLDILLDESFDLAVSAQGDFVLGESEAQHVDLLLQSRQGDWRENPLVGVGIARYLKAPYGPAQAAVLGREISVQLERDGLQVLELDVADLSDFKLNAERL
ncbi:hypothetical protein LGH70_19505 [Hymenobacter sp. BT635]|uniref:Oxidase n=1 Tax=Hymenobacter nitidus TaxID=2880929 RepID=A0ABS8AIG9_9BACT|nr:hypothetical protein [Hymenobacter nitidus]MCB2379792.1 hypothetical protein [Hymenobacter nitidus]